MQKKFWNWKNEEIEKIIAKSWLQCFGFLLCLLWSTRCHWGPNLAKARPKPKLGPTPKPDPQTQARPDPSLWAQSGSRLAPVRLLFGHTPPHPGSPAAHPPITITTSTAALIALIALIGAMGGHRARYGNFKIGLLT